MSRAVNMYALPHGGTFDLAMLRSHGVQGRLRQPFGLGTVQVEKDMPFRPVALVIVYKG